MGTLYDLVKFTVTNTGASSTIKVGTAIDGARTPADAGVSNGESVSLAIYDPRTGHRAVGTGVYNSSAASFAFTPTVSTVGDGENITLSGKAIAFVTPLASELVSSIDMSDLGFTVTEEDGEATVSGTLNVAHGGTGATTLTGYVKGSGTSAMTASATIPASDIASGKALTKTDDTNVTVTLGGTPASALLKDVSITMGWTGQLSVPRGGTGAATLTGYVVGNGTSAMTASSTIPASDISGTLGVGHGGTGATTLTTNRLLLGNGTSAVSASSHTGNGNNITVNSNLLLQHDASNGYIRTQSGGGSLLLGANGSNYVTLSTTGNISMSGTISSGAITSSGKVTGTASDSALVASNGGGTGQTSIMLTRTGAAADEKRWEILAGGSGNLAIRTINDAYSSSSNILNAVRGTGIAVSSIALGANRIVIDNAAGRVGINRTPTTSAFEVQGDILLAGGGDLIIGSASGGAESSIYNDSSNIIFHVNGAERGRFEDGGALFVNTTTNLDGIQGSALQLAGCFSIDTKTTESVTAMNFFNGQGTTTRVGWIGTSGSTTSYNTTSDERLKKNIVDAGDAGDTIDAIKVRAFDWKLDDRHVSFGMIAQELADVFPDAVSHGPTEADMMAVDFSKLVPLLVKEIQSLRARVAALEGVA